MLEFQRSITGELRGDYGYMIYELLNGSWRVEKDRRIIGVENTRAKAIKLANKHYAESKKGSQNND